MVASDPAWPVLKESSSVRASVPRTSPRMIRSGTPAQRRLQKIVEGDAGFERIGLAFGSQDVRLLNAQLGRILDDYDPLSCSGIAWARMFSRVVFPVPVPPLIRMVLPAQICAPK